MSPETVAEFKAAMECTMDGDCDAAQHLDFCYNAPTPAPAESTEPSEESL